MPKNHQNKTGDGLHLPVLASEVLAFLAPKSGESYLDLTAGYGGHAELIAKAIGNQGKLTLVDRDGHAVEVLKQKFPKSELIHQDFLAACQQLVSEGQTYDMVLADLGVSSPHFDNASRGFSFSHSGPLDMRMDQRQEQSAEQLVNQASEADLASIIKVFGEEAKAGRIARAIVGARPLRNTSELAAVISSAVGKSWRPSRIHPATKTFQALRIAVNAELTQLQESLPLMSNLLAPGGRLAIISFHSLEDRIVKRYFAENAGDRYDADLTPLTKKPVQAGQNEIALNPRARSALLRAVAKIKR